MFHDESWKLIYFGVKGQRPRSWVTKNIACVGLCTLVCAGLTGILFQNYFTVGRVPKTESMGTIWKASLQAGSPSRPPTVSKHRTQNTDFNHENRRLSWSTRWTIHHITPFAPYIWHPVIKSVCFYTTRRITRPIHSRILLYCLLDTFS